MIMGGGRRGGPDRKRIRSKPLRPETASHYVMDVTRRICAKVYPKKDFLSRDDDHSSEMVS